MGPPCIERCFGRMELFRASKMPATEPAADAGCARVVCDGNRPISELSGRNGVIGGVRTRRQRSSYFCTIQPVLGLGVEHEEDRIK